MIEPLYVLLVADTPGVADPALAVLRRAGYDPRPRFAATPAALGAALEERAWDAVLVFAAAKGVAPLEALGWASRRRPETPAFVLGGVEGGVAALFEAGALDLLGTGELARLGPALARVRRQQAAGPSREEPAPHAVAAASPIGVYRTSQDGRVLYANPAMARLLGRESVEEVLGLDVAASVAYPRETFEARLRDGAEVSGHEVSWTHPDGRTLVTREHARAVRDADGAVLYYEGTIEDVTDAREALRREGDRAGRLAAALRQGAALDAAGSPEEVASLAVRAAEEVLGCAAVLVRGDRQPAAWSEALDAAAAGAAVSGEPVEGYPHAEALALKRNGTPLGQLVLLYPSLPEAAPDALAEHLAARVAAALARVDAERAVQSSEAALASIAEATGHAVYRRRFGSRVCEVLSDSIERLTGYPAEVLKGMGGLSSIMLEVDLIAGPVPEDGDVSRATAPYHAVYRLRAKGGETRWVEDRTYPWTDAEGTAVGLLGVLVDVTERHREREAERDRQRALTSLSMFEGAPECLLPHATAEAARLLGVERVSVWVRSEAGYFRCHSMCAGGREVSGGTPPLHYGDLGNGRRVLEAHRVHAVADVHAVDTGSAFLDGHYAEFDIQALLAAPMRREGNVYGFLACEHVGAPRAWSAEEEEFVAALADLLALALERQRRARVERALRESEERYRAVSELAADYAYGVRVDEDGVGTPDWATRAFERMTGVAFETVTTATELIRSVVHPEDQERVAAAQRRLYAGEPCDLTFRIRGPEGEERWIRHRCRPVTGPDGRVRYLYATGRDVTDRVRVEWELQAAVAQAQEARALAEDTLRRKGAFVAAMSHEIRTPLTGIIGFAEVLADEVEGVHSEFAALIAASSQRLLQTLNSVLDLARLESGEVRLERERVDLVREVRQAVDLLRPIAQQRGLALELDTPPALEAELDAACLNRVVNNLVGNALKFTDAGAVTVTVAASASAVTVAVADTGAGIDEAFLPHLFEEFKQESSGLGRHHEGSGLGLTITRGLVELMGGAIAVESAKGVGTTFTVTLPLALPQEAEASVPPEGGRKPEDGLEFVSLADLFEDSGDEAVPLLPDPVEEPARYTLRSLLGGASPGLGPEGGASRGDGQDLESAPPALWASGGDGGSAAWSEEPLPRLLLVEDHDETRHLLLRMLRATYEVSAVADARTALDLLSRERFDLLVLDIHLGGRQTGADVLRVARTLPGYARTPAVAVTAYALPGDREGFLEGGFDGYVSKPFTAEVILAALAEAHRA